MLAEQTLRGQVLRLAGLSRVMNLVRSFVSTASCIAICSLGQTTFCASGSDKDGWTSKPSSTGNQGHPLHKRGHMEHKETADQDLYMGMVLVRAAMGPPAPPGGPLAWQFQGDAHPVWHCLVPCWAKAHDWSSSVLEPLGDSNLHP